MLNLPYDSEQKCVYQSILRHCYIKGQIKPVLFSLSLLRDSRGKPTHFLCTVLPVLHCDCVSTKQYIHPLKSRRCLDCDAMVICIRTTTNMLKSSNCLEIFLIVECWILPYCSQRSIRTPAPLQWMEIMVVFIVMEILWITSHRWLLLLQPPWRIHQIRWSRPLVIRVRFRKWIILSIQLRCLIRWCIIRRQQTIRWVLGDLLRWIWIQCPSKSRWIQRQLRIQSITQLRLWYPIQSMPNPLPIHIRIPAIIWSLLWINV